VTKLKLLLESDRFLKPKLSSQKATYLFCPENNYDYFNLIGNYLKDEEDNEIDLVSKFQLNTFTLTKDNLKKKFKKILDKT